MFLTTKGPPRPRSVVNLIILGSIIALSVLVLALAAWASSTYTSINNDYEGLASYIIPGYTDSSIDFMLFVVS
jgi:hypothetical protein